MPGCVVSPWLPWWQYGSLRSEYRPAIGDRLCDVDEASNPEPLDGNSNELYFTCLAPSHEAGAYPFDLRINDGVGLGRASVSPSLLQYTLDGRTLSYVHHADVSQVSFGEGGVLGGAVLTIYGSGFASNPANNSVEVAGSPCPVLTSSPTVLTCLLGPAPSGGVLPVGASYAGGRGLLLEVSE